MKRIYSLIFLIGLLHSSTIAQQWKSAPLEIFGGISNFHYFGDIGGSPSESNWGGLRDINLRKIRPGLHIGARYQIIKPVTIKVNYDIGFLAQSDKNSKNDGRNLAFLTLINEFAVSGEFYIIPESDENYYYSIMQVRGGLRHFRQPFSLYVTLGAGGIYYNVWARDALTTHPRFVDTESWAMVIPVGIGAKYALMPSISAGAEIVARYTTTDYLDGYTSDFSEHNDIYYTFVLKVNYKIRQTRKRNIGLPRRRFSF